MGCRLIFGVGLRWSKRFKCLATRPDFRPKRLVVVRVHLRRIFRDYSIRNCCSPYNPSPEVDYLSWRNNWTRGSHGNSKVKDGGIAIVEGKVTASTTLSLQDDRAVARHDTMLHAWNDKHESIVRWRQNGNIPEFTLNTSNRLSLRVSARRMLAIQFKLVIRFTRSTKCMFSIKVDNDKSVSYSVLLCHDFNYFFPLPLLNSVIQLPAKNHSRCVALRFPISWSRFSRSKRLAGVRVKLAKLPIELWLVT